MHVYRLLTGPDDSSFCHKVTKALADGWVLYGEPKYVFNPSNNEMRCAQAVTKEVADQPYDPDKKLVDYQ